MHVDLSIQISIFTDHHDTPLILIQSTCKSKERKPIASRGMHLDKKQFMIAWSACIASCQQHHRMHRIHRACMCNKNKSYYLYLKHHSKQNSMLKSKSKSKSKSDLWCGGETSNAAMSRRSMHLPEAKQISIQQIRGIPVSSVVAIRVLRAHNHRREIRRVLLA